MAVCRTLYSSGMARAADARAVLRSSQPCRRRWAASQSSRQMRHRRRCHAKVFVGSANLTEAAQLRHIEIGIVRTDNAIATPVERHIDSLIEARHLQPLPL